MSAALASPSCVLFLAPLVPILGAVLLPAGETGAEAAVFAARRGCSRPHARSSTSKCAPVAWSQAGSARRRAAAEAMAAGVLGAAVARRLESFSSARSASASHHSLGVDGGAEAELSEDEEEEEAVASAAQCARLADVSALSE